MASKDQIIRLILTAQRISAEPFITIEELSRQISFSLESNAYKNGCSHNTIKRDIEMLRNDFGLNIKYSRREYGYYIDRSNDGFNNSSFESLIESFDILSTIGLNNVVPSYIDIEPFEPKGTKHLQKIGKAIAVQQQISFEYSKYSNDTTSRRTVSPYAIKKCRGRWYVIGKELGGSIKTFGLDRIENLKEENREIESTPSFSMSERFAHSYGIYSDPSYPVKEVVLAFDAEDGRYIKSVPLHHTQRLLEDNSEGVVVSINIRITFDFIMELLSRSNSLKVISPDSLRKKIIDIYSESIKRNTL